MAESCLRVEQAHGVSVVSFHDNAMLDTLTIQRIGRELYEVVEQPKSRRVLIDFQNIRFLSSQALGVLLTLRHKAEKSGVEVVFAGLRPELAKVFTLTKLDKMFQFFPAREAALRHFGVSPADGETQAAGDA